MIYGISNSWKTVAVLTMIFFQIIAGIVCATPLSERALLLSVAVVVQDRDSPRENRMLPASDVDHHVRCEQPCPQSEPGATQFSEDLRYFVSSDTLRESQNYLISRPPRHLA